MSGQWPRTPWWFSAPSGLTGGFIANTVSATSLTPDTNTGNNSSSVNTTITTAADLQVDKAGPAEVTAGQTAAYTITVGNAGPSDALDVSVSDMLPAGTGPRSCP